MFAATKSFFAKAPPSGGGPTPAWSIDWSTGTPSGYTLTRASSGTFVDSSGYIASASTDVARLTHDSNGNRLGLLVEESRTNLQRQSETFGTTWTVGNTTITANDTAAPDNTTTADLLKEDSATAMHSVYYVDTVNSTGTNYTFTVFAKAQNRSAIAIQFAYDSFNRRATQLFDLSGGAVSGSVRFNGASVTTSAGIENYGNGWYRCRFTVDVPAGNFTIFIALSNSLTPTWAGVNMPNYTGNGTDGVWLWGAQMEAAATATAYIGPTTTGTVDRDPDRVYVLDSTITSWGDPGALVIHFYPPGQAGTLLSTDNASAQQLGLQASSTTAARAFWSNGDTSTGTIAAGVNKAVHYWNGTASSFCINGGTVQTGTNNVTTFGNIDFVTFGMEATDSSGTPGTYTQYPNLVIRKVEFYAGTLSSSDLQTITT